MGRSPVQYAKRILSTLVSVDPPVLSSAEIEAILKLREATKSLMGRNAGPEASKSWDANQRRLAENIASLDCRFFLRWPVIQDTMFPVLPSYVFAELGALWKSGRWAEHWRDVVKEDDWGAPVRLPFYPWTSANRLHHAYHILRFEQATGVLVGDVREVIEFGGGYGSMCRVSRRHGFSGRYLIVDLPLTTAIQAFYLNGLSSGSCRLGISGWQDATGTFCESDLGAVGEGLKAQAPELGKRLFMATWSLSEVPTSVRREMLPVIKACDAFLIAFQAEFDGVDNRSYFECLRTELGDVDWQQSEIPHLRGNYYLFGVRKRGPEPVR